MLQCAAMNCGVLRYVAVCCSALQYVAVPTPEACHEDAVLAAKCWISCVCHLSGCVCVYVCIYVYMSHTHRHK